MRTYLVDLLDLAPLPNRPTIQLGEAIWEAKIAASFSTHSVALEVPSRASWMAIDLRSTVHPQGLEIALPSADQHPESIWRTPPVGPGWVILHILPGTHGTWTIRAANPMPSDLNPRLHILEDGFVFDLSASREMSDARLVGDHQRVRLGRDGALLGDSLMIYVPPILRHAPETGHVEARLWFQWVGKVRLQSLPPAITIPSIGQEWQTSPARSSARASHRHHTAFAAKGLISVNQPPAPIELRPHDTAPARWLFLVKVSLPTSPP